MPETTLESVPTELESIQTDLTPDARVDALIALASRMEALGKAMDQIRKFVLARALPGDWVAFKEQGSEDFKCELSGAGAERIANDVGISFVDWKDPWKETGADSNGSWYNHWYECSVLFRGRRIDKIQGCAGTRDKFFGKEHGTWKKSEDCSERDIKMAARRNCMKEGVKVALGLRRIPKTAIVAIGLDPSKIKTVEFTGSRSAQSPAPRQNPEGVITEKQRNRLFAIMKEKGVGEPAMRSYLSNIYSYTNDENGLPHTDKIRVADYDKIISWVEGSDAK